MGGEVGSQDMAEMADRQAGIDRLSYKVTDTLGDIAYRGDLEALNARLDRGDDPNDPQQLFSGAAPLFCAARYGHPACVASLLARNADVAVAHPEAGSALHGAAGSGHADIVRLLLAAGAPPNTLDSGGDSALTLAAYSGHTAVLRLLLDAGADASLRHPQHGTAWARGGGRPSARRTRLYFQNSGARAWVGNGGTPQRQDGPCSVFRRGGGAVCRGAVGGAECGPQDQACEPRASSRSVIGDLQRSMILSRIGPIYV
mmetsp:Transcript_34687/g.41851  ORF Transcript_34687/g.41851 Transcript_34687/m.41851 type:complete len:258 (-) Transcript_34687:486-1259(-)